MTPGKQLYTILNAAESAYQNLKQYHPEVTVGGDDFMDIWLYVVLKANVRKLASVINFIREYGNPTLMQGELGYYFSTLELAAAFLKELTQEKLNTSTKISPSERKPPFLVCERAKHIELASKKTALSIVKDRVELTGYQMYIVEDWLFNTTKFHHTIILQTGKPEDKIVVSILKIKESKFVTVQEKAYYKSFFQQSDIQGVNLIHTEYGVLLVADDKKFSKYFLVEIPGGDYDRNLETIKFNLTLRRLGFEDPPMNLVLTDELKTRFRKMYKLPPNGDFANAVHNLVLDLQIALKLTGFLAANAELDGIYSDVLARAAQKFQKHFNREESSSLNSVNENSALSQFLSSSGDSFLWPVLQEDGRMNPESFEKLRTYLHDLVSLCLKVEPKIFGKIDPNSSSSSAQKSAFNVLPVWKDFADMLLTFQKQNKLPTSGSFNEKTINFLKEKQLQIQNSKVK